MSLVGRQVRILRTRRVPAKQWWRNDTFVDEWRDGVVHAIDPRGGELLVSDSTTGGLMWVEPWRVKVDVEK